MDLSDIDFPTHFGVPPPAFAATEQGLAFACRACGVQWAEWSAYQEHLCGEYSKRGRPLRQLNGPTRRYVAHEMRCPAMRKMEQECNEARAQMKELKQQLVHARARAKRHPPKDEPTVEDAVIAITALIACGEENEEEEEDKAIRESYREKIHPLLAPLPALPPCDLDAPSTQHQDTTTHIHNLQSLALNNSETVRAMVGAVANSIAQMPSCVSSAAALMAEQAHAVVAEWSACETALANSATAHNAHQAAVVRAEEALQSGECKRDPPQLEAFKEAIAALEAMRAVPRTCTVPSTSSAWTALEQRITVRMQAVQQTISMTDSALSEARKRIDEWTVELEQQRTTLLAQLRCNKAALDEVSQLSAQVTTAHTTAESRAQPLRTHIAQLEHALTCSVAWFPAHVQKMATRLNAILSNWWDPDQEHERTDAIVRGAIARAESEIRTHVLRFAFLTRSADERRREGEELRAAALFEDLKASEQQENTFRSRAQCALQAIGDWESMLCTFEPRYVGTAEESVRARCRRIKSETVAQATRGEVQQSVAVALGLCEGSTPAATTTPTVPQPQSKAAILKQVWKDLSQWITCPVSVTYDEQQLLNIELTALDEGDSEEMESVRGMTQRLAARVCEATATTELGNGRFLVAASVGDLEALAGLLAEKKFIE